MHMGLSGSTAIHYTQYQRLFREETKTRKQTVGGATFKTLQLLHLSLKDLTLILRPRNLIGTLSL